MFIKTVYIISWFGDRENKELIEHRKKLHNEQLKWLLKTGGKDLKIVILAQFYEENEFLIHPQVKYIIINDILLTPPAARNKLKEIFYASDEDYCLFLDDDIILEDNFFDKIRENDKSFQYILKRYRIGLLSFNYSKESQYILKYNFFDNSEKCYIFRNFKMLDETEIFYNTDFSFISNYDMSMSLLRMNYHSYYISVLFNDNFYFSTITKSKEKLIIREKSVFKKNYTNKHNKILDFEDIIPNKISDIFNIIDTPYTIEVEKNKIKNKYIKSSSVLFSIIDKEKKNRIINLQKNSCIENIKQIYVSSAVEHFKEQMKNKYDLIEYHNKNEPAIFNGLYNKQDWDIISEHQGLRVIVWCGNDANLLYRRPYFNLVKNLKNTIHIAKSKILFDTLTGYGISCKLVNVTPTMIEKNKKPRGENVYFYGTIKHGSNYIESIQRKIPYKIIHIKSSSEHSKEELEKIYESCFIGVRLTTHDGLPNTVIELGLMGRRCVHNGELPNTIPWSSVKDVADIIKNEYSIKDEDNQKIVDDVYNYLNISDEWKTIKIARQAAFSYCLRYFKPGFFEKYGLIEYENINEPTIFKGLYKDVDLDLISKHKGYKIIIWSGSDASRLSYHWAKKEPIFIEKIKQLQNVRHIAISNYIQDSLSIHGIESELIPVASTNIIKKHFPRDEANKVYFYGTEIHGAEHIPELQKLIPFEIIHIPRCYDNSQEELDNIYKSCFVGVRLTKHDGLSNTVIELGLMGRRCVYNGNLPNSIPWKTLEDVAESIKKEYENRKNNNKQIVEDMYNYLDINENWRIVYE